MRLRKIRIGVLTLQGIVYRLHIVVLQSVFWYVYFGLTIGQWKWTWAIASSVIWNAFNTILYYNYHYWWARAFRLEKRDKEKGDVQD